MSNETQAEQIERLETLNHKLSMQIITQSDRLQDSALQIAADAWDSAIREADKRWSIGASSADALKKANPYRAMIAEKEAAK